MIKRNPNANKEQYQRRKKNNLYTITVSSKLQNYKIYDRKHFSDSIIVKAKQLREMFENGKCYYCGENNKFKLGLDRIDNKKSHKLENTVIACGFCNKMRGAMKQKDFIKYIVPGILEWKKAGGGE